MTERTKLILTGALARDAACRAIMASPEGYIIRIDPPNRSLEANAKLWPMLRDIADQVEWYGKRLDTEEWKDIFTAALRREKVVPGLNGGFVVLGQHTKSMSRAEFADLIELIYAFGAEHDVMWTDPAEVAARRAEAAKIKEREAA